MKRRKDKAVKLEPVGKVIVTQLADGRAVISLYARTTLHYIADSLFLSKGSKAA